MQELTEREQKLLDMIKKFINMITIWGIYEDKSRELRNWAYENYRAAGLTQEWQNEILHTLEDEFGLKYTKLNPETYEEIKEDGNQDSEGV